MDYLYIKAFHLIFVVTWFAALFYIIRLFIYHKEAEEKPELARSILQKQYLLMAKRLLHMITWPSAVLTTIFAMWPLILQPACLRSTWMIIKIVFVGLLYLYHWSCQVMYNQVEKGNINYSSFFLRVWNEVATIILFAVVFLVILKTSSGWVLGVVGIVGISVLLMLGVKLYERIRKKTVGIKKIKLQYPKLLFKVQLPFYPAGDEPFSFFA